MSSDKPTLKPPPTIGSAFGPRPAAPDKAGAGPGASAAGTPRLSIGTAPPPSARGENAPPAPPSAAGVRVARPPAAASGGLGSRPATPGPAPVTSAPAAPQPTVTSARRPSGPRRAAESAVRRSRRASEPGRAAREARPPKGTVRSNPEAAEVVRAARTLADLLIEENKALRVHDVEAVKALTERKNTCTHVYRQRMLAIHRDPGHLTGLPEDEREIVRATGVWLEAHLSENARLLKSTMEGTNRLMGLVVKAVREVNEEQAAGYAADGRLDDSGHVPSRVTLSYNQNL